MPVDMRYPLFDRVQPARLLPELDKLLFVELALLDIAVVGDEVLDRRSSADRRGSSDSAAREPRVRAWYLCEN